VAAQSPLPFEQLDFLYVPSGDVAADCDHFTDGLGARLVFRIEAFGAHGLDPGPRFGIPHGPCCSFQTPGGHRIAIYELTRRQVAAHFAGRRDF
jgi:hypothetical protein